MGGLKPVAMAHDAVRTSFPDALDDLMPGIEESGRGGKSDEARMEGGTDRLPVEHNGYAVFCHLPGVQE